MATTYTPELGDKLCAAVSDGDDIRSICKRPGMPSKASFFRWLREYPDFAKNYEIAKDEAITTEIDETKRIADDCKADADSIRKARLRIETRFERAQLIRPKLYGKKLQLTGEGGGPVQHKLVTQMTDDELMAVAGRKGSNAADA
jgi:transposase-like protein